jgi:pyruvate dehydrogenase complex dehydrogenase (E1) component
MSFVRMMTDILKDKNIGERIVPIVPDEARTFGMEGLFRQIGIYSLRVKSINLKMRIRLCGTRNQKMESCLKRA